VALSQPPGRREGRDDVDDMEAQRESLDTGAEEAGQSLGQRAYRRSRCNVIDCTWNPNKKLDAWLAKVPYGIWHCRDGRQVLFNRFYMPLWQRAYPGAATRRARADEWVKWERQDAVYEDGDLKPARRAATMERINRVMEVWGLPEIEEPPR
jgi:hypothetical protein